MLGRYSDLLHQTSQDLKSDHFICSKKTVLDFWL
jgi:hypothetical protein